MTNDQIDRLDLDNWNKRCLRLLTESQRDEVMRLRAESQAAYDHHHTDSREWSRNAAVYAAQNVGECPTRRAVKLGRKITKAEGRAMALDCGFDPAVLGLYHEDADDARLADAEHAAAQKEWGRRHSAAIAQFEAGTPQPAEPAIKSWYCYCVSLMATELGYGAWSENQYDGRPRRWVPSQNEGVRS